MASSAARGAAASVRLDARVKAKLGLSWSKCRELIESGKVFIGGESVRDIALPVLPDVEFDVRMNAPRSAKAAPASREELQRFSVVFEDPHLLVVDKGSGLSSVPFEAPGGPRDRSRRPAEGSAEETLQGLLESKFRQRLHVVQRLDRETSGLIVFARTSEAARALAQQFRFHTIHRRYLALVHGKFRESSTLRSNLASDRGDGLRGTPLSGARFDRDELKPAVTHVRRLANVGEGERAMSLIECRLETGRTHQIRIHLSEAGHPLLGDELYQRDFAKTPIPAERILLHAAELGLRHPIKEGLELKWRSVLPDDFRLDPAWAAQAGIDPRWFSGIPSREERR